MRHSSMVLRHRPCDTAKNERKASHHDNDNESEVMADSAEEDSRHCWPQAAHGALHVPR